MKPTQGAKRSNGAQSVTCALFVVPLVETAVWAGLHAVGGETGAMVMAGVRGGTFCGVYAFGPSRWLADPDIAGWFGREHPLIARAICGFGVAFCYGGTAFVLLSG